MEEAEVEVSSGGATGIEAVKGYLGREGRELVELVPCELLDQMLQGEGVVCRVDARSFFERCLKLPPPVIRLNRREGNGRCHLGALGDQSVDERTDRGEGVDAIAVETKGRFELLFFGEFSKEELVLECRHDPHIRLILEGLQHFTAETTGRELWLGVAKDPVAASQPGRQRVPIRKHRSVWEACTDVLVCVCGGGEDPKGLR